jgi:hypothetical protein
MLAAPVEMHRMVQPLAVGILIAAGFFIILSARSEIVPIVEIGTIFVAVVTVYFVVPLAVYLALDGTSVL